MTPQVTVIRNRYVRSFPRHEQAERAYVLPLGDALARAYRDDAHFAQYITPNARRLSGDAPEVLGPIELRVIVFDVDCEAVHGTSELAPPEWRAAELAKVEHLAKVHPGLFAYQTRGGYRLVWCQHAPTVIAGQADARRWRQEYAIVVAYLARRFDIHADPACSDWTRLFRLPRATREPGHDPEEWGHVGDVDAIGTLRIQAAPADVVAAKQASKAFHVARRLDFTPANVNDGQGLLFHLLRARGDILREHAGGYVIRCPRERGHSTGCTGDTSTLLYPPATGEEVGAIHCMHAHCSGLTVAEWLREFSFAERDTARQAAGIVRAA